MSFCVMALIVNFIMIGLARMTKLPVLTTSITMAMALSACDRNTTATNPTQHHTIGAQPSMTVVEDVRFLPNPSPSPSNKQNASIITTSADMATYQYAYMAIIQIMHQDMAATLQAKDPDVLFAQGMIAHHEAAINMAKIQLAEGSDAQLRDLAQDIIIVQQNEIQLLRNWLAKHPDSQIESEKTAKIQAEYNNGMNEMHEQMMAGIMSVNPDVAFAQAMLPHHKGALALAQVEIKYGTDNKLRKLADNIIEAQQDEIQLMQRWLQQSH